MKCQQMSININKYNQISTNINNRHRISTNVKYKHRSSINTKMINKYQTTIWAGSVPLAIRGPNRSYNQYKKKKKDTYHQISTNINNYPHITFNRYQEISRNINKCKQISSNINNYHMSKTYLSQKCATGPPGILFFTYAMRKLCAHQWMSFMIWFGQINTLQQPSTNNIKYQLI